VPSWFLSNQEHRRLAALDELVDQVLEELLASARGTAGFALFATTPLRTLNGLLRQPFLVILVLIFGSGRAPPLNFYTFFGIVEIAATAWIVWRAWRWQSAAAA